jgi:sporulation protein YlmC with PRC-barrel domain
MRGQSDNKETKHMKRSIFASSVATCFFLGLAAPVLAAQPPATGPANDPSASAENLSMAAQTCLSDLRAFDKQMDKDGYWLGGSGYGLGYPVGYDGFGSSVGGDPGPAGGGYQNARPGYEVRTLLASANILARRGQQQPCEDVLAATRDIYKVYVADLESGKVPTADVPNWRKQQIAAAVPVTDATTSFRSDELIDSDVRNAQNEILGSVDDIVMRPQTGKIAYLVIARGGFFGIDESYVPIPWADFKITPKAGVLVLDVSKSAMDTAPQVDKDQFTATGHFNQQSEKVDAYWKTHLTTKDSKSTNG